MKISKKFLMCETITSIQKTADMSIKNDSNMDIPMLVNIYDVEMNTSDQGIGSYEYWGAKGNHSDIQTDITNFNYDIMKDGKKIDTKSYYDFLVANKLWKANDFEGFLGVIEPKIEEYIADHVEDFTPDSVPGDSDI
jgi:hypothetical protein